MDISRRAWITGAAAGLALAPRHLTAAPAPAGARVLVVKESDRAKAVAACFEAADFAAARGRDVAVKANFNSADAFPASTHPETLRAMLATLHGRGASSLLLAERSGMGETRQVLTNTGAADVLKAAGARMVVLDELGAAAWQGFRAEHWPQGFFGARLLTDAECAVQTMCCKTHRFGGHVTLSLKNTVGLVAKRVPGRGHDFMQDLHGSRHQRAMIAEANLAWRPALSVMDCLEAFADGGPERGRRAAPGVFLASEDRCALDAAAIALLRLHGMSGPAAQGPIGKTDQLARAIELGVGAPPERVQVVAVSPAAREVASRIQEALAAA
jgi:uncharacterized protein (DUF362 family)